MITGYNIFLRKRVDLKNFVNDELLNGFTVDTNSHWLKNRLRDFSLSISRAINIPDNQELIISELEFCIKNNIDFYSLLTYKLGRY